jgi:hypothetical protein
VGRFFNSTGVLKRAVSRPSATVVEGLAGMAGLCQYFLGGPGGGKPLLFTTHKPCQMYKKKPIAVHVTRW